MFSHDQLRIIIDQPLPGVQNMATDEAILIAVNEGKSPATLRFYQWDEPTISLGYFQKYNEVDDLDDTIGKMPVVRRQTGGGAILHDDELTYSLTMPLDNPLTPTESIEDLYRIVHDAFVEILAQYNITATYRGGEDRGNAQRGPFFCFARTHRLDLVIDDDKLLGSAQRRVKNAALQHGSLILKRHFKQQPSAEILPSTGNSFDLPTFIEHLTTTIAKSLKMSAVSLPLSKEELQRAGELQDKYQGDEWNQQR